VCEIAQDGEEVRHGFAVTSIATLNYAEGNAFLGQLPRLADQLDESSTAETTRPPQTDGCLDRCVGVVIAEQGRRDAYVVLDLDPEA
jgi:hypothetical protein